MELTPSRKVHFDAPAASAPGLAEHTKRSKRQTTRSIPSSPLTAARVLRARSAFLRARQRAQEEEEEGVVVGCCGCMPPRAKPARRRARSANNTGSIWSLSSYLAPIVQWWGAADNFRSRSACEQHRLQLVSERLHLSNAHAQNRVGDLGTSGDGEEHAA